MLNEVNDTHAEKPKFLSCWRTKMWRSPLYTGLLRTFGYRLINLQTNCPVCGSEVPHKKWGIPVRLTGYAYRLVHLVLKKIGIYSAANIITIAKVK